MTTTMTWDSTAFLVSIKARIDGCVCNALIIFIATPSISLLSPSGAVAADIDVPCSSSALSLPRLIIRLPVLFIILLV